MEWLPSASVEVVKAAVRLTRPTVARVVVPSRKLTVPVGVSSAQATVAVKSPPAAEGGGGPAATGERGALAKPPLPLPSRMLTLLLLRLATARSGLPSPLKSPTATEAGVLPTPTGEPGALAKPPLPLPS